MNESNTEIADVLEKAADALWMYGRAIGVRQMEERETMCVLGAIAHVMGDATTEWSMYDDSPAAMALAERLTNTDSRPLFRVWAWNDSLPLTPENDALVIDTLRRCAKDLRNEVAR